MATGAVNKTEPGSGSGDDKRVALNLMRLALPLLDRAGDMVAAARLQHAIDAVEQHGREAAGGSGAGHSNT